MPLQARTSVQFEPTLPSLSTMTVDFWRYARLSSPSTSFRRSKGVSFWLFDTMCE